MQEHTCGMSLDGPAPPSEAAVPLLDDNERDNEDEDGDGDGDCPVHVDDDGGVDYILPAYYAPIVSQGAYMHPPALNIKTSFPEYLDWSNFAPPSKPGPAFRIPQGDVHGCGASHDDWLDCLHEGSDAAAGLGVFEEACHVLDQTSMVLDMELDHMA